MIEKLKDIFYDLNDLLVTLIIILVIVLAIAYVFTNAFDLDLNRASVFDFFTQGDDPTPPTLPTPETSGEPEMTPEETTEPETPSDGIVNIDPESEEPATGDPEDTDPTPQDDTVVVTMPAGGNLTDFAMQLQQSGVIKDFESFVNLVSSQGLDTQVQAGDYTFPLDITDAEAVRIMFGFE